MHAWLERSTGLYQDLVAALARLQPVVLLLFRVWVALVFWRAGVVKFDDPSGTAALFQHEYHVPLLAPGIAAFLGTWIELVVPWFLAFGLFGRLTALFLFVYNLMAVISYPELWPDGFWVGLVGSDFDDHKIWALMLLAVIAWGPGLFSVDGIVARFWRGGSQINSVGHNDRMRNC